MEQTVELSSIKIPGQRIRKNPGEEMDNLMLSLMDVGLMQSPVVNSRMELVAGMRRTEAVKQLAEMGLVPFNFTPDMLGKIPVRVEAQFDDDELAFQAEVEENAARVKLSTYELLLAGMRMHDRVANRARARMMAGGDALSEKGKTVNVIGSILGISGETYRKGRKVLLALVQDSENKELRELVEKLEAGSPIEPVYQAFLRLELSVRDAPPHTDADQNTSALDVVSFKDIQDEDFDFAVGVANQMISEARRDAIEGRMDTATMQQILTLRQMEQDRFDAFMTAAPQDVPKAFSDWRWAVARLPERIASALSIAAGDALLLRDTLRGE